MAGKSAATRELASQSAQTALQAFKAWQEEQETKRGEMLAAIAAEATPEIKKHCEALAGYLAIEGAKDTVFSELKSHGLLAGKSSGRQRKETTPVTVSNEDLKKVQSALTGEFQPTKAIGAKSGIENNRIVREALSQLIADGKAEKKDGVKGPWPEVRKMK